MADITVWYARQKTINQLYVVSNKPFLPCYLGYPQSAGSISRKYWKMPTIRQTWSVSLPAHSSGKLSSAAANIYTKNTIFCVYANNLRRTDRWPKGAHDRTPETQHAYSLRTFQSLSWLFAVSCRSNKTNTASHTNKYRLFWRLRVSNSIINSLTWLEFRFVRDSMPALIICKFDADPMKTDGAMLETVLSL